MIRIIKVFQFLTVIFTILFLLVIITILPIFLTVSESGSYRGFSAVITEIEYTIQKIADGDYFSFRIGKVQFSILETLPAYFINTLILSITGGLTGLITGTVAGIFFTRFKWQLGEYITSLFSFIPDFMLILILQFIVIFISRIFTGFPVRVGSLGQPIFVLPILTICITSGSYLTRSVMSFIKNELTKPYLLYAYSKGLSINGVYIKHLFPAIAVHLKSDLFKYLSLIFTNIMILERVFNIKGISRLLFSFAYPIRGILTIASEFRFEIAPQLNIAFTGILSIILVFFIVYFFLYIFVSFVKRIICSE
jgi:peptide/nickel transport system permease protein